MAKLQDFLTDDTSQIDAPAPVEAEAQVGAPAATGAAPPSALMRLIGGDQQDPAPEAPAAASDAGAVSDDPGLFAKALMLLHGGASALRNAQTAALGYAGDLVGDAARGTMLGGVVDHAKAFGDAYSPVPALLDKASMAIGGTHTGSPENYWKGARGDLYSDNLANIQKNAAAFDADNPVLSTAAKIVGGFVGAGDAISAFTPKSALFDNLAKMAPAGLSTAANAVAKVAPAAVGGGTLGAVQSGLNSSDYSDLGKTAQDAAKGFLLGGGGGAFAEALPGAQTALGQIVKGGGVGGLVSMAGAAPEQDWSNPLAAALNTGVAGLTGVAGGAAGGAVAAGAKAGTEARLNVGNVLDGYSRGGTQAQLKRIATAGGEDSIQDRVSEGGDLFTPIDDNPSLTSSVNALVNNPYSAPGSKNALHAMLDAREKGGVDADGNAVSSSPSRVLDMFGQTIGPEVGETTMAGQFQDQQDAISRRYETPTMKNWFARTFPGDKFSAAADVLARGAQDQSNPAVVSTLNGLRSSMGSDAPSRETGLTDQYGRPFMTAPGFEPRDANNLYAFRVKQDLDNNINFRDELPSVDPGVGSLVSPHAAAARPIIDGELKQYPEFAAVQAANANLADRRGAFSLGVKAWKPGQKIDHQYETAAFDRLGDVDGGQDAYRDGINSQIYAGARGSMNDAGTTYRRMGTPEDSNNIAFNNAYGQDAANTFDSVLNNENAMRATRNFIVHGSKTSDQQQASAAEGAPASYSDKLNKWMLPLLAGPHAMAMKAVAAAADSFPNSHVKDNLQAVRDLSSRGDNAQRFLDAVRGVRQANAAHADEAARRTRKFVPNMVRGAINPYLMDPEDRKNQGQR